MYLNFFKIWVYGVVTFLVITLWGSDIGTNLIIQWTIIVVLIDTFIIDFRWNKLIGKVYRKYYKKDLKPEPKIEVKHCRYCDKKTWFIDGVINTNWNRKRISRQDSLFRRKR